MARYKFYKADNKIVCISSFAKKAVRGIAKCSPHDEYDEKKGMRLAQLRCDAKIAQKRVNKAFEMVNAAWSNYRMAENWYDKMNNYVKDSIIKRVRAQRHLEEFEKSC